jgi:4-amino-4-deoxy-L-arabinose transferase-like glycosyltransferase
MGKGSFFRAWWIAKVFSVILWVFAIVAAYFWAHKPFGKGIIIGVGQSLAGVVIWLTIVWLGAGLGRRLVSKLLVDDGPVAQLVISTGLGMGVLSLLVQVMGLLGLLYLVPVLSLMLVLGIVLWRDLGASLQELRNIRCPRSTNGFQRWLLVYAAVSLALTFLIALAPPVGWDTLVYHLTGPRFFVESGRFVHPIDLPYLGFPQLGEMHFTLGLLLGSERAAPLFHFGYGVLAVTITVILTRRFFGNRASWMAAALLLSVPTLFSLMTRAYVDATLVFYATAAVYAFLRWREQWVVENRTDNRGWLLALGAFCGFCGGIKYTAVAIPLALGMSLVWVSRRDGLWSIIKRLALVAFVAVVIVVPGLLENWLTTGNPVYPFFFSGGVYWDDWRAWWYDRPGTGLVPEETWRLLTAPLEATILGTEGTDFYEATIGPLLLPSAAVLIVVWRSLELEKRSVLGHLFLFFVVNYVLWLNGLARTALLLRTRFLFLTFGAVAVMGGVAVERLRVLRRPSLDVAWLVRAIIGLVLALLLFSASVRFLQVNPLPVLVGLESRDNYLTRRLGWYHIVVLDMNRELPASATVLFLWEPRSYHCQGECWPDALLDRFLHATHLYGHDAKAIADAWREEGVTHVLLNKTGLEAILAAGFDPVTQEDLEVLDDLRSSYLRPVHEWGDAYVLYELRP